MKPLFGVDIAMALGLCCPLVVADAERWKLAFQDDFERRHVGSDWIIPGEAEIVDGRLKYGLDGQHVALLNRHFAADVRIEFDAEAAPEKPPCDLSIGLGCGKSSGPVEYGYLLAFGGNFNSMNQIQGGRDMRPVLDWHPRKRIEPGRIHHLRGTKEGKTLTLEVDGEVVLTSVDQDPLGGPGYDMVGLVTWNGMLVDNVSVHERRTPHPDTPRYVTRLRGLPLALNADRQLSLVGPGRDPAACRAVDLFNMGKPREAEEVFLSMADPELRAAGAAYAVGHLYYEASDEDFARVGQMLIDLAAARPGDERLQDYGELGRRLQAFSVMRFEGRPNGELAVSAVLAMGQADNPVYDKATFFKARLLRAHSMESANRGMDIPARFFSVLKKWYPEHPSLKELTGEPILWGTEWIDDASSVPAWARYLRELYARQCAVLNWWFTRRQNKDGQLGGGWGDDCEILRDWGPLAVVSTGDPAILAGIERLCQGIWGTAIRPEYGFGGYGDVEHSSEPSADTQPTMMILSWGDPLWIERNMRSAKTIRDIYMGVDQTGHYRFKSGFYGDDRVGQTPKQEGDVQYNARTMKHLQHLAWWGNREARRVYLNWVEGWLEQTLADDPRKPAGVVPGQLFFPSGTVVPPEGTRPEDWYSTNAPNVADPPGMGSMIQGSFLAAYRLTGDSRYLEPMHRHCYFSSFGPLVPTASRPVPGSRGWILAGQQGDTHTDTMASFHWLSGDRTVEEYLLRFATPYQRYAVTHDLDALIKAVELAAKAMRVNFRLMTEELLQTDRAGLPGIGETLGAYTGAIHTWRDALMPTMALTWEVPDPHFAALVVAATETRLRVWIYSFHDRTVRLGMRLWRLIPGLYLATHGEILPGESTNLRYRWSDPEDFTYRRRLDTYRVDVPPRKPYVVDLRLVRCIEVPSTAPDPAIADRDVVLAEPGTLQVTVHNLGSRPADQVVVALEAQDECGEWKRVSELRTGHLAAPELDPVTETLRFERVPAAGTYRVILDPGQRIDELYEGNNVGTGRAAQGWLSGR